VSRERFAPPLDVEVVVACDVDSPLCGPRGAARVFGPQKGATPAQVEAFDLALAGLARKTGALDLAELPGAGAAGGLGFGMMAFFGATLKPGFDLIADAAKLAERIRGADLVITGEGRLDASSLHGKTAIGVARLCKEAGVPCVALAGSIGDDTEQALAEGLSAYFSICNRPMTLADAISKAPDLLAMAAANVVRLARLH
jgi:glycerate kinase